MDRSDVERLVRLEEGQRSLEERIDDVAVDVRDHGMELREHRTESTRKHEELRDMLAALGHKLDERAFRWRDLLTKDTAKILLTIAASLLGAGSAGAVVKALFVDN